MPHLSLARRTLAAALAATLSVACSGGTPPRSEGPGDPAGASAPSAAAGARADEDPALPDAPALRDPRALAGHLDLAAATLRDPSSRPGDLRRAGEFEQLAVRALASAPADTRRRVLTRLRPDTAVVVRACLAAAAPLRDLTAPQRRLPRWRIVAPPAPGVLLGHYREAQRRTGVPWEYLAAIHLTETRMGRIRGTSTAGAQGPMQFLPSTWDIYGAGGDIRDPRDAILGAARLLKANGAPRRMAQALYRYNPSDSYVRAVSSYARSMRRVPWAYTGYWQWRVLYRHVRGTYALPVGYPEKRAVLID